MYHGWFTGLTFKCKTNKLMWAQCKSKTVSNLIISRNKLWLGFGHFCGPVAIFTAFFFF